MADLTVTVSIDAEGKTTASVDMMQLVPRSPEDHGRLLGAALDAIGRSIRGAGQQIAGARGPHAGLQFLAGVAQTQGGEHKDDSLKVAVVDRLQP